MGYTDTHMERPMMAQHQAGLVGPINWREALDVIALGQPDQVCIILDGYFLPLKDKLIMSH
jgi:hypothetical protein